MLAVIETDHDMTGGGARAKSVDIISVDIISNDTDAGDRVIVFQSGDGRPDVAFFVRVQAGRGDLVEPASEFGKCNAPVGGFFIR